jgi:hypothetical protein
MLALGCLIARKKLVDLETVCGVIADFAPSDKKGLIRINKQALEKGAALK